MFRNLVALALFCSCAAAQGNFATISGKVEDASHGAIGGARISVTAKDTSAIRNLTANADGLCDVADLLPDDYRVDVEGTGFTKASRQVTLEVAQNMGLDLLLSLRAA